MDGCLLFAIWRVVWRLVQCCAVLPSRERIAATIRFVWRARLTLSMSVMAYCCGSSIKISGKTSKWMLNFYKIEFKWGCACRNARQLVRLHWSIWEWEWFCGATDKHALAAISSIYKYLLNIQITKSHLWHDWFAGACCLGHVRISARVATALVVAVWYLHMGYGPFVFQIDNRCFGTRCFPMESMTHSLRVFCMISYRQI